MSNIVENQVNKFFLERSIKKRKILSSAFNMQCEKITTKDNKKFIIKYYIDKKEVFNSITSETKSLIFLSKNLPGIFPKIFFKSKELLITEYIEHNNIKKKNY